MDFQFSHSAEEPRFLRFHEECNCWYCATIKLRIKEMQLKVKPDPILIQKIGRQVLIDMK
jgi:hypothetical protein